ncbi:MAG: DUF3526 domain-containing protein [Pseudomonadota bacterium]
MTVFTSAFLERRLFLFASPGLIAATSVIILAVVAVLAGNTAVSKTLAAQAEFVSSQLSTLEQWRETLASADTDGVELGPYDARPMNIQLPAILPPAPLSDFGSSGSNLYPTTTTISGWSNPADLFAEYEFANPTPLSLGDLDLTFLVISIMPLIMVAVSFDILASDRDSGRTRLIALQAGELSSSVWQRLLIRNGWVWGAFCIVALVSATILTTTADIAERLHSCAIWLLAALIYGSFWFGLIALIGTIFRKGETVASALFAAWATFVLALPAIGSAFAEAAFPPPSRLAFLSEMRQGEVAAIRDTAGLTAGFLADHPELTVSDEGVPAFYSSNFLANLEADRRTAPILESFNTSREKRSELINLLQYLSPAMIADRALTEVSSGGSRRAMRFQHQAREALSTLHERIGPAVVAKQRISIAEFDEIPPFRFQQLTIREKLTSIAPPLIYLFLISAMIIGIASRRLSGSLENQI